MSGRAIPARFLAALLALAALAGCATTRVTSSWRDPAYTGGPFQRMIIFVAAKDESVRRFAENQAVLSLPPGTRGTASYLLFESPEPDMAKMRSRLAQDGYDAALVSRLVSVDKTRTYHPPEVHWAPFGPWPLYGPYYRSFYWYYPHAFTYMTPGYTTETTRVLVETVVYRLPAGEPVWSAVSESVNPNSTLDLVNELIDIVGKRLRQEGLIAPGAPGTERSSDGTAPESSPR